MKLPFILFLFLVIWVNVSGQIYDPYVSNLVLSPSSPWGPVNTVGTATFTLGNGGPQAMSHWNECGSQLGCKLIVQISPNTAYTIIGTDQAIGAIPTGTMAAKFSWAYIPQLGLQGVQIATINAGESGDITFPIKHIAISTDASTSPCNGEQNCFGTQVDGVYKGFNGLVVNLLPPGQPANNNELTANNNLGGYEYTLVGLPLNNLTFQAKLLNDRKVELSWTTLNEQNNCEFEVERYDARNKSWNMICKKAAVGFSTKKSEYFYIDQLDELKESKVYYRLKLVEMNGYFHYTDVRMVNIGGAQSITLNIFPTPFTESIHLDLHVKKEGQLEIQIFDVLGKRVLSERKHLAEGFISNLIRLDHVPPGTYSVHVFFNGTPHIFKTLKIN